MLSRRDLIHSRQHLRQRLVCAVVSHRPDPLDWAGRHATTAMFAGLMVLVIALGGTAIYGKIFPGGSKAWRKCDAVIVERETGAKYVCGVTAGKLHPTLNFASASMIIGSTKQVVVARASLTWPRGEPVGIDGAPDNLPEPKRLLKGRWSLCSVIRPDETGTGRPSTVVLVGASPAGGQAVGDRALMVAGPDGGRQLIWRGTRYPISKPEIVLPVLGLAPAQGVPVGAAWLAPIPVGATLGPIEVTGVGQVLPKLPRMKVGQLARVTNADGTTRFYLAQQQGLQEVTELQKSLVRTNNTQPPVTLSPTDLATPGLTIMSPMTWTGIAPPTTMPSFASPRTAEQSICATLGNRLPVGVVLDGSLPSTADRITPSKQPAGRAPVADAVIVPATYGALVTGLASDNAPDGARALVTDLGIRYALADADSAKAMGLSGTPVPVPAGLLDLLPEGPSLDRQSARRIWHPERVG